MTAGVPRPSEDALIEHTPEDMTITAEAGMTLQRLQEILALHKQWLPLDPAWPESLTLAEVVMQNLSGPRRCGWGTVRDYVIGMRVMLANGKTIHAGGKVVKNVAGYDLCKLFVGSGGKLGTLTEVTFMVRPKPAASSVVEFRAESWIKSVPVVKEILASPLVPVVFDLHQTVEAGRTSATLTLGFEGTRAEVEWQVALARTLADFQPGDLTYEAGFWARFPDRASCGVTSVVPGKIPEYLEKLGAAPFVARIVNGVIYHPGDSLRPIPVDLDLSRRAKAAFDPRGVLAG